ncbi:zinc-dependent metalloprotease [Oryzobacter terrae]|uniref:zinc-dependent metalloprotease n=1 Tax=Oryzobacter terrae TaxID=1620385 RepID=UPI00366C6FCF
MGYVDWEFAKTTGRNLVPAGPSVSPDEARAEVAAIREAARAARGPVAETARMQTPPDAPDALVVDRATWIAVNADSMRAMLDPTFDAIIEKRGQVPGPAAQAIGGKVTGAEAGALLAFMAPKVLGQYDLAPDGTPALLLVAPNLVAVADELGVDREDFRRWVCMHEETHRVQFTANPWLRDHVIEQARGLAVDLAPDTERLQEVASRVAAKLPEIFKEGSAGLADLVTTPEQRERMAALTAVMSLLEGHADVVMDDVGPAHIPTVDHIRARFTEKRKGAGAADRVLRRLLGLEAKMRQYRDGAVFVRGVQDAVGVEGFNAVWTSPETLPLAREIEDPRSWVRRVHG